MLNTFEKTKSQEERRRDRERQMAIMDSVGGAGAASLEGDVNDTETTNPPVETQGEGESGGSIGSGSSGGLSGGEEPTRGAIENARKFLWDEDKEEEDQPSDLPGRTIDWSRGDSAFGKSSMGVSGMFGSGFRGKSSSSYYGESTYETPRAGLPGRELFSQMGESIRNLSDRMKATLRADEEEEDFSNVNLAPRRNSRDSIDMAEMLEQQLDDDEDEWARVTPMGIVTGIGGCCSSSFHAVAGGRKRTMLMVALMALAVGLVMLFTSKGDGSSDGEPTVSAAGYKASARLEQIKQRVLDSSVTHESDFAPEDSPQYRALEWIADSDGAKLASDDDMLLQRYALAVFFFATSDDEDAWKDSTNWMTEKGFCSWHGVQCHHRPETSIEDTTYDGNNDVTHLMLTANNVKGKIPGEIKAFTDLRILDLAHNGVSGTIPKEIGSCKNLLTLHLGRNSLDGSIPSKLGALKDMTHLYLQENALDGNIPSEIGNLEHLKALGLYQNQLTGTIPNLNKLKKVTVMYLDNNSLSGKLLVSHMGEMTSLTDLRLGMNKMHGSIPHHIGGMKNLETLYLDRNEFTGSIPSELGLLEDLDELHLYGNKLDGKLPPELGMLENLRTLYLDNNEITGSIPELWGAMGDLEQLFLYKNKLSGPLPSTIGMMKDLLNLRVQDNNLSGTLPRELGSLFKLEDVFLDGNKFEGTIPSHLGGLKHLTKLRVDGNDLTGEVPESVCTLTEEHKLTEFHSDCEEDLTCDCCTKCF